MPLAHYSLLWELSQQKWTGIKKVSAFVNLLDDKWRRNLTTSLVIGVSISALFAGRLVSKCFITFKVQIRQITTD
jgi:hypothetical protein